MNIIESSKPVSWEPMVYKPTISIMDRCVLRYKKAVESGSLVERTIARIVAVVAAIFCAICIFTIPLITKFVARLNHKREIDAFNHSVKNKQAPDIPGHIEVDTPTQSLNHVMSVVIHKDIIWTKRKLNDYGQPDENAVWEPMYFDGWPKVIPVEIRLDGANLIVIDDERGVHYKKIFKEHYENVDQFYENIKQDEQPSQNAKDQSIKNNLSEFTIYNNKVWHRNLDDLEPTWNPVYIPLKYDFYGKPKLSLKELKINENDDLVAIDNKNGEHTVSKENYDRKENYYTLHVKANKDNWKDRWFTLPYLNHVVNAFTGKRLHLPKFTKAWAIGHRGQFNHYIEDRDMKKHAVGTGVTTLYILEKHGNFIYLFDPWKPKNVQVKIPVPGTADCPFIAENISVAASTILVTGYNYEKQEDGKVTKKPAAYTMIADVDSLGWNPTIHYSYETDEKDPLMRRLPTAPKGWKKIALPEGEISSACTILQTGEGNDHREMRFIGKRNDQEGYWHKGLQKGFNKVSWEFTEMKIPDPDYGTKIMREDDKDNPLVLPEPRIFNWKNGNITLNNFNNGSVVGTLRVGKVELLLHRKENIILKILLLGHKLHRYDLVLPEDANKNELPEEFQTFFKDSNVVQVKIKKKEKDNDKEKEKGPREGKKLSIRETIDPTRIGQGLPHKKLEIVLSRTDIESEQ